jgi:hypothetical protein
MKRRHHNLHLVGQEPADVFDDLGKLREDLTAPPQRRTRDHPRGPIGPPGIFSCLYALSLLDHHREGS